MFRPDLDQQATVHFATLDQTIPDQNDQALAVQHAPRIRFDDREPFLPSVVGYTVFRQNAPSASFPREIILPPNAVTGIEYAIWWDWEIQHLYELEHIWVYLGADEAVVAAEASSHGGWQPMINEKGTAPLKAGRVTLYSEPGKHAFTASAEKLVERARGTTLACTMHSGKMGVLVTPLFAGLIDDRAPLNNNVAHAYMERLAFTPSFEFNNVFDLQNAVFVPWESLFQWIPSRVKWWANQLRETTPPHLRRVLRIAHRGASAYAQEGSSASIKMASELGADMVEVDIRMTADGIPVIAHDPDLERVFGVPGQIADLTLEQIHALTPQGHQPILTFDDMVMLCGSLSMGLYLDIKEVTPDGLDQVVGSLRKRGMMSHTIFGSFNPSLLIDIKEHSYDAVTSILFSQTDVDPVEMAVNAQADYVHPCWERFDSPTSLLTEQWLYRVRAVDLGIICWHEERPAEIAALYALGVDGICSDQPELLLEAHRNAWQLP